jgi:hypothetical protein
LEQQATINKIEIAAREVRENLDQATTSNLILKAKYSA